jgi:hypothetical protein
VEVAVGVQREPDRIGSLDQVADGYRSMNERESIKFLIEF